MEAQIDVKEQRAHKETWDKYEIVFSHFQHLKT